MDIWFTSDTHAHHNRIMEFCPNTRRGSSTEEMTELLIDSWNSVVKSSDKVYHLGDLSFGGKQKIESFVSRLNGSIHLIYGNHCMKIRSDSSLKGYFASVQDYKTLKIGEDRFVLFHFPLAEWWDCHKGVIHLHGHLHGNKDNVAFQQQYKIMDVGIDTRNDNLMLPYHIDEVLSFVKDKEVMTHH